jgi:hypothetical protein
VVTGAVVVLAVIANAYGHRYARRRSGLNQAHRVLQSHPMGG